MSQRKMARDALRNSEFFQRKIPEWQANDMGIVRVVVQNSTSTPTQTALANTGTEAQQPTPQPTTPTPQSRHTIPRSTSPSPEYQDTIRKGPRNWLTDLRAGILREPKITDFYEQRRLDRLEWWSEEHERIREAERKISRQKEVDKRRKLAEAKEQARQDRWKLVGMEPSGSQLVPRVDPGQSIRTRETVAKEKKPCEKRDKTVYWRPKGYIPEPTQFDIAVTRTYGVLLPGVNPKKKFAAWKTVQPNQCASVGQASPHNQQMDQGEIELTVADSRLVTERTDAATSPCVEPKSPKSPELAVTKVVAMVKPTIRKQTAKETSRLTTSRDGASMARTRIQAAQRRARHGKTRQRSNKQSHRFDQ